MDDERKTHLLLVVDRVLRVRDEWAASDVPYITEAWEEAMDDMAAVFSDGDLPGECRQMATHVNLLLGCWREWWDRNQRADLPRDKTPAPGPKFWGALSAVEDARDRARPQPVKRLESVASLKALQPPVGDQQICRIYGWRDEFGHWETWKIEEELAEPGKHSTKDPKWCPPHEKRRQEAETAQRAAVARAKRSLAQKLERMTTPAPESIAMLVRQGVSAKQIAHMHKISIDEVMAHCDEQGIARPVEDYAGPNHTSGQYDRVQPEDKAEIDAVVAEGEAQPAPMTLEQEIVHYHKQAMDPKAIAEAVGSTPAKVKAILKRWEEDPAAFGEV